MINRDKFLNEVNEEKRLRLSLRRLLETYLLEKKQFKLEEAKLRTMIRQLVHETQETNISKSLLNEKEQAEIHASTGINRLSAVLNAIKETSKDYYMQLTSSPDQRKAFISTWKWLFKAAFSNDEKLRDAAEEAAQRINKGGFESPPVPEIEDTLAESLIQKVLNKLLEAVEDDEEDDEAIAMKITDPNLKVEEPEEEIAIPTPEEEMETRISDLVTAPDDADQTGAADAARAYHATHKQVMSTFNELRGDDAEDYYRWFFINMLGSRGAGFEDMQIEPVTGHFQYAEKALEEKGIETSADLLPEANADAYNLTNF
jgi:hypothetical protein